MAEAIFNHLAPQGWLASSAGYQPERDVHLRVVSLLSRYAIPTHLLKPKPIEHVFIKPQKVITFCDDAELLNRVRTISGQDTVCWPISDPEEVKGTHDELDLAFLKSFRQLELAIGELIDNLRPESQTAR
jgi:arsenate reductase